MLESTVSEFQLLATAVLSPNVENVPDSEKWFALAKKKARNRPYHRPQRFDPNYRILLHTGSIMGVGPRQWKEHLEKGNLIRETSDLALKILLHYEPHLALLRPDLICYEASDGVLVFEARTSSPRPLRIHYPNNYWSLVLYALIFGGAMTKMQRDEHIRAGQPLLQLGNPSDTSGPFVMY